VRDFDAAAQEVEAIVQLRLQSMQQLAEARKTTQGMAVAGSLLAQLDEFVGSSRDDLLRVLRETVTFPPHHIRHFALLDKFWARGTYDQSVFLMTKFPDAENGAAKDAALDRVLKAVERAVRKNGYIPRIASDGDYHAMLWDNVELHLIGCRQGIAIVEDKYLEELNPNVAMEWGWMRAMGKSVLFLVEKSFTHARADVVGMSFGKFDWDKPGPGIGQAIAKWAKLLTH
jgi:hypothetical protein